MKILKTVGAVAALGGFAGVASATDPYSSLISAATWSTLGGDAVTVGVALAGVYVIFRGARMLLGFVKR
jgi:multisubunit Na+/H+ antiporter MnhG subunit